MVQDRIVKFCARFGPRSVCLVMTTPRSRDVLIFWQISVNISKIVQDRDILTMEN